MLIIIVLCTNDKQLVADAVTAVKQANPEEFTPAVAAFLRQLSKQRKDSVDSVSDEHPKQKAGEGQAAQSSSTTSTIFSGLARTVTSGGMQLLQGLGMIGSNKKTVQIDYIKKVLHTLEYQGPLPQGEYYYDLGTKSTL